MRAESIKKLLTETADLLERIKSEKQQASEDPKIKTLLEMQVMYCLGNLRAGLDYSAHDIFDVLTLAHKERGHVLKTKDVHFPYTDKQVKFRNRVQGNLPRLEEYRKDLFDLIESIQPFSSNDSWLVDLCERNNAYKHVNIPGQVRKDNTDVYMPGAIFKNCDTIIASGNRFNGVLLPEIRIENGRSVIDPESYPSYITLVSSTEFMFEGTNIEIVGLLEKCLNNVSHFTNQLYSLIDNKAFPN